MIKLRIISAISVFSFLLMIGAAFIAVYTVSPILAFVMAIGYAMNIVSKALFTVHINQYAKEMLQSIVKPVETEANKAEWRQ